MLRRVALVGSHISKEHIASVIGVTEIDELGATLAVTSSVLRLLVAANVPSTLFLARRLRSSETLVLTRATGRNIPEDGFLQ
jgi:hypothetical protein